MKLLKIVIWFVLTIFIVITGSFISARIWSDRSEEITKPAEIIITPGMTIGELIKKYSIPEEVIIKIFGPDMAGLNIKQIPDNASENKKLVQNIERSIALYQEKKSKNWFKIPLKFILWFFFMGSVFYMLKNRKINPRRRILLYSAGVIIFGIILGADPSPMGTIKDAVALYGEKHVIFIPRMAALAVFLFTVFAANKMICSWGCQFGILQDLIFRINRTEDDRRGILKQFKIPFVVSNSIRIIFFIVFTLFALVWGYDIIAIIDPFKAFKPQFLLIPGLIMLIILLTGSLFIYRPWCHFFCPFGLAGWLVEKVSRYKIAVDYSKCTSCLACEKACPSSVMSAVLRRDKVIPDCFSCGTCLNACRFDAVSFSSGKRMKPESNSFNVKKTG